MPGKVEAWANVRRGGDTTAVGSNLGEMTGAASGWAVEPAEFGFAWRAFGPGGQESGLAASEDLAAEAARAALEHVERPRGK